MTDCNKDPAKLRNYALLSFVILATAYFFVYFQRLSVGIVGTDIVTEVGGSVGILSSVYFWTYTAMQIPSGLLADRIGPRMSSTIFLTLASVGSFITFAGQSFELMIIGKMMIAAGMAVVYIPLMKIVSVWFPNRDFAVLTGVVIAVGNVGAIAASGPLNLLADAVGWRDVFLILGAITLMLAILCLLFVRDHPKDRGLPSVEQMEFELHGTPVSEDSSTRMPVLKGLRIVFGSGRKFWTCALAYFLVYGTIMTFQGTWAVTYFNNVYDFVISASWMMTLLGIGKILSTVMIGALTTRGIVKSKRTTMLVGTAVFTAIWIVITVFAGKVDSYIFWSAVSFLFGFFGGFMTLTFTQIREWFPTAISGTAVSGANIFLFLGASICTTISGLIIGTTYSLENFSHLWTIMTVFSAVAVVLVFLSVEKRPDQEPVGLDSIR